MTQGSRILLERVSAFIRRRHDSLQLPINEDDFWRVLLVKALEALEALRVEGG